MKINSLQILFISLCLSQLIFSCTRIVTPEPNVEIPPNILLIIADDLGKDAIEGYIEGTVKPNTPNINSIRNGGVTFNNLWVYPTCTPTRASILTGKYGYRTNVKWASDVLDQSEVSLQQHISNETNNNYASAIIGKWHLSGNNLSVNPESFGIDYYAGLIRGTADDYYNWQFTEDGSSSLQTEYSTEVFTDLSIDWIEQQSKPWFLWLAYNAPHTPFHVPPSNMHSQGSLPAYANGIDAEPYFMAAIEAMDFQIGRLLESMTSATRENTLIIFIGDNGTPNQVAQSPYTSNTVKGSLFQGGINVPMFILGSEDISTKTVNELVTSTDIFATIAEFAGSSQKQVNDGISFKDLLTGDEYANREFQYAEMDDGNIAAWTIRNQEYKLIVNANGEEKMYYIIEDAYEQNNLLDGTLTEQETTAKIELEEELTNIRN